MPDADCDEKMVEWESLCSNVQRFSCGPGINAPFDESQAGC